MCAGRRIQLDFLLNLPFVPILGRKAVVPENDSHLNLRLNPGLSVLWRVLPSDIPGSQLRLRALQDRRVRIRKGSAASAGHWESETLVRAWCESLERVRVLG